MRSIVFFNLLIAVSPDLVTGRQQDFPAEEFRERRSAIMSLLPDGILFLHARSSFSNEDQLFTHGFQQEPSFYYFSGLANAVGAILAVDGLGRRSILFVPTKLSGLAGSTTNAFVQPSRASAEQLLLDEVRPWEGFSSYLDSMAASRRTLVAYTEQRRWGGSSGSNPPELAPIDEPLVLWPRALKGRWPDMEIRSATDAILRLRAVKGAREIAVLRKTARISAQALIAGIKAVKPGISQREAEAAVVCECMLAGGEGPSFWPWVMSGPNARIRNAMESLVDYRHMNRVMNAGELVRVDVGCDVDFYKGDVGRTVPVSGTFSTHQREIWGLLVRAYRAGLSALRPGANQDSVVAAALRSVRADAAGLSTPQGREAARIILAGDKAMSWHVHTCGLEAGEPSVREYREGMIVILEPMLEVAGEAYYLEDMMLVTAGQPELLSTGLPTTADEIEAAMRRP